MQLKFPAGLKQADLQRADDDFILAEFAFQPLTQRAPVIRVDALGHDFDDGDSIAFGFAIAVPQTLSGRSNKAGRPAELVGQFFQKVLEPVLTNRLGVAGLLRHQDLDKVAGGGHDPFRPLQRG